MIRKLLKNLNLDEVIAFLGILFSIVLTIFFIIYVKRVIYLFPLIFTFFSCLIWLVTRNITSIEFTRFESFSTNYLLISIFFILFTVGILSIYLRPNLYERPLLFFVIMSLMSGIIFIELFFVSNKNYLILFQIMLLGVSLTWSELLIFPDLLGVDPWWHQMFTLKLINSGHVPENYVYSKLPIFHLLISLTSLITGLNYKFATMLSVSFGQIVCNLIFIYLVAKFLFKNNVVGLLASLLLVSSSNHIYMSVWSIPNAYAAVFMLPVYYLLLKVRQSSPIIAISLSMVFSAALILTHSISSMCMALTLFVSWIGFYIYNFFYPKEKIPISLNYSILFIASMFAWWSFISDHVISLAKFIKIGFSRDLALVPIRNNYLLENTSSVPFLELFFNNIGLFLFFSISFIGCFYMISKKNANAHTFSFSMAAFTPLAVGFFSLATQHNILEGRWWYFSQLFLSIPLAISFLLLFNLTKKKSVKFFLLPSFIAILVFLWIMVPPVNADNPVFSPNTGMRYSLKTSELQAIETCSFIASGNIKTDQYFSESQKYNYYKVSSFDSYLLNKNFDKLEGRLLLVRKDIIGKPFKFASSVRMFDFNIKSYLGVSNYPLIYDCGTVEGYFCI